MVRRVLGASYRTARRVVVGVIGATVTLLGVALLVLPGPAFVVIPVGLGILSLEFAWARRWLRAVRRHAESIAGGVRNPRGGAGRSSWTSD